MSVVCNFCKHELNTNNDFAFYGISGDDIFKMIRWLENQNATVKDLDCSSLQRHYREKQKVMGHLSDDFK